MKIDGQKLHNTIRKTRAVRSITQDELAKAAGVSRQTIISIERGRYNPSIVLALKIAGYLEVSVEELFSLDDTQR